MNAPLFLGLFLGGAVLVAAVLLRAIRRGGFDQDAFPSPARRGLAIGFLFLVLLVCVVAPFSTGLAGRTPQPSNVSPASAFALHAVFLVFLTVYYLLAGGGRVLDFLKLRTDRPGRLMLAGIPIAAFAWAASLAGIVALELVLGLFSRGASGRSTVSPIIPWIVSLPLTFKVGIVLSAMVFEEAFFRSFLQPRIGAVGSTLFFTLAHGVYGEPMMLLGILILSSILAVAFEIYKNALPVIVAHGAFDAFEIFVLIPFALKFVGAA
jgi:membrane protease YdiL (CAAX protease family)